MSISSHRKTLAGLARIAILTGLTVCLFGCSDRPNANLNISELPATTSVNTKVNATEENPAEVTPQAQQASSLPAAPNQGAAIAAQANGSIQQADSSGADPIIAPTTAPTNTAGNWLSNTWQSVSNSSNQLTTGSMDWANQTFKSLKDQGLTSAESTSDWLTEDWQNMESWEYKVVKFKPFPEDELETELNRLGKLGWECFSINAGQMFFKKRRESYLRRLPFKDLLRLAPLFNQGN